MRQREGERERQDSLIEEDEAASMGDRGASGNFLIRLGHCFSPRIKEKDAAANNGVTDALPHSPPARRARANTAARSSYTESDKIK